MNKNLLGILTCTRCNRSFKKTGSQLRCPNKHLFNIKGGVPIMIKLNPHLKSESKEWDDNWKKEITPSAMKAYNYNMQIFKKLGYWDESAQASRNIPSKETFTVLDLGCGSGTSTAFIRGKTVVGIDLSQDQLIRAKKKYKKTNYVVCNAENLPFKSNSFDMVVVINMLHHVKSPAKVLKEAYRVLMPEGKLLTVDPNLTNPIGFLGRGIFNTLRLKNIFPAFPQFFQGEHERQFTKGHYYKIFRNSPFSNFTIKPHRIERLLFFVTILFPKLVNIPGYERLLLTTSRVGNAVVQIPPFDYLCYFWFGEAIK